MLLEIKMWPESQEVMDDDEWFFVQSDPGEILGSSAYARIVDFGKGVKGSISERTEENEL